MLGLPTWALGLALAAEGGAALLSAAFIPRLPRRLGEARTIVLGLAFEALSAVAIAASVQVGGAPVVALGQLFGGFSLPLINISLVTLRQRITPRPLLGRVNAVVRMFIMAALPVGALLGGPARHHHAARPRRGSAL
ncbi:hypothetical protein AB0F30_22185 [Streptomyces sp. NPDC029006]|uniref:hypothetical protein n=1 Tax=Streptomyces sp. NPDC029006 TaxID=3155467 RepID=UPI0033C5CB44